MDRITALPFAAAMFVGMMICLEIGRRVGARHLARDPQLLLARSSVDSAVFALYGLLLAFTFSGAPGRLDMRRQLNTQEANAIGTAYLRVDLLPADLQPAMRERFRRYLDARLRVYQKWQDIESAQAELSESVQIQKEIWKEAVAATGPSEGSHSEASKLLLPALNEMIDITTTRMMAAKMHPPLIIFGLLFLLALVCSLLAGYGMATSKQRSWLHIMAFAVIAVITVFVVLEIEYPRMGLIGMTTYDQVLVDLRQSMQ